MLETLINQYNKRYPNNPKDNFHLIESNGKYLIELNMFIKITYPTAYIYQTTINNKHYIFIAL